MSIRPVSIGVFLSLWLYFIVALVNANHWAAVVAAWSMACFLLLIVTEEVK